MNYNREKFDIFIIVIIMIIYLLNNNILKIYITNESIRLFCICYLNDIMCPSVLLASTNIFIETVKELKIKKKYIYSRNFIKTIKGIVNSLFGTIIYCFIAGLYWEYIYKYGIKDNNDMICYVFGGIIYYVLRRLNKIG